MISTKNMNLELEVIKNRAYGNYRCSCGCGKILGVSSGSVAMYAYGVAEVTDDEGYAWRMFTPKCWERISSQYDIKSQDDLNLIYNSYPTNEEV